MSNIAVIGGAGRMGIALIDGLIAAGECAATDVVATARHPRSLDRLGDRSVGRTLDNVEATQGSSVVVLAVHPIDLQEVLAELATVIADDALVLSIVTGATLTQIERALDRDLAVVRASPNIAAVVGSSMTGVCGGTHASQRHLDTATRLLTTVGRV